VLPAWLPFLTSDARRGGGWVQIFQVKGGNDNCRATTRRPHSRYYIFNSEGIRFTASRHIVGRTSANRCTWNRRGNRQNHFGDFRYASSEHHN
jgi:hypothetical protein